MANDSKVSVIIPCYNQANFLSEAIESALNQTIQPSEVIVIDDGSTDHTPDVAQKYERVTYIRQENRGLSAARNVGFFASSGELVIFLDSDDRLPNDSVRAGMMALNDSPEAAFAYGRLRRIALDGSHITDRKEPNRTEHYRDLLKDNYIPTPGMVMFRRSALEAFGLFNEELNACEDYDLYLRITRHVPVIAHPGIAIERRVHPQAMSRDSAKMLRSALFVHSQQQQYLGTDKSLRKAFEAGRKWWKEWYGSQLLTQLKIDLYLGEWRKSITSILALLRYHPVLLTRLTEQTRLSNEHTFKLLPNGKCRNMGPLELNTANRGSKSSPDKLSIKNVKCMCSTTSSHNCVPRDLVLLTIHCENATQGTRAIFDNSLVKSAMLTSSTVQALVPMSTLGDSKKHVIQLIG